MNNPVGIIAGDGNLPELVVSSCVSGDIDVVVLSLDHNKTVCPSFSKVVHQPINIAAVGKAINFLNTHQVKQLVFIGSVQRPKFSSLRPDTKGFKLITRLNKNKSKGDNGLLTTVIAFFEDQGFEIIGVDQLVSKLLAPKGHLTTITPDEVALKDIDLGRQVIDTLGHLDIGQSVIVQQSVVLGIEAIEGTQRLIERCSTLQQEDGPKAILIKCKKPTQEHRIDLPTIGPDTIEQAYLAGIRGIAVQAGSTLIINKEEVIEKANAYGMFVIGLEL